MDKQELRNALTTVEDRARTLRNSTKHRDTAVYVSDIAALAGLVTVLTQLVRQEIVK